MNDDSYIRMKLNEKQASIKRWWRNPQESDLFFVNIRTAAKRWREFFNKA